MRKKYLSEVKEWRYFFSEKDLKTAQSYIEKGSYSNFINTGNGVVMRVGNGNRPAVRNAPTCYSEDWDADCFSCTCAAANSRRRYYSYYWDPPKSTCAHEAALMLLWERVHGPWEFKETEEEWQERKREEEYEAECDRREKKKAVESKINRRVTDWTFPKAEREEPLFFDIPSLITKDSTTLFAINTAKEQLEKNEIRMMAEPEIIFANDGEQAIRCRVSSDSVFERGEAQITVSRTKIYERRCSCHGAYLRSFNGEYLGSDSRMCGHEIAAFHLLCEYVNKYNPGDATDKAAENLFRILDGGAALEVTEETEEKKKQPDVSIKPRLLVNGDNLSLTFKISKNGGKGMILKGFRQLSQAMDEEKEFSPGKNLSIDFSRETVDEESQIWLSYILLRINDADRVNKRLVTSRYGYYGKTISVQSNEILNGAALDQFYDLAEGMEIEFEDKGNRKKGTIHIGEARPKVRLECTTLKNADTVVGVIVNGTNPRIAEGQNAMYVITDRALGRIGEAEWNAIAPFRKAADKDGHIHFTVGKSRLAEFYYRILPQIMENPYIEYEDLTEGAAESVLPPEPVFTFRLDLKRNVPVIRCSVSYDEETEELPRDHEPSDYLDRNQENRVLSCIVKYFPLQDVKEKCWYSEKGDDALFLLMSEGIRELERYGEVLATEEFSRRNLRRPPKISFQVSVKSGLLDIGLLSTELSTEELSEIYHGYQLKKRYHKLRDGSFLDFREIRAFEDAEEVAEKLNVSMEDLIQGQMELPLFRALYLDSLLEQHEELVNSRDKTYRTLIKNFRSIRDSDYDVPEQMEEVLRPYQVYGHKWMRTLTEAGFGGILADEMGLGKTLEAISVISAMKKDGEENPSLVVCPASLVYNWEEEIKRFAPDLAAVPVAGNAADRKKLMSKTSFGKKSDIYITSYDLLRKDIDLYREKQFGLMVIDEAQYIKNTKAQMTKAAKIIRAKKRMALTGTPIENRLTELWSIFDFLMPGFLYDYETFSQRFETPITKNKDADATNRLKQMTSPFILRRKKEEVLKDLPPKLEEVRYARFEKKQRELYDAQVLKMKGLLENTEGKGEDKIKILAELMHIRQTCCDPELMFEDYNGESAKREACLELIQNAISGGHRMLVFSQFTSMLELLEKDLKKEKIPYFKLTGATPKDKRIRDMHEFNDGDVPVYLISLKAGGTGLNLTGADVVIHYDPWWNTAAQNQATDRAHRIGQEKKVTVYSLIVKDTIEERILALQEAKKDLADAILSGEQKSLMSLTEEELMGLL